MAFLALFQIVPIDIGNGDDLHAGLAQVPAALDPDAAGDVPHALPADADGAHHQPLAGSGPARAPERRGRNHIRNGNGCGCGLEECPSCDTVLMHRLASCFGIGLPCSFRRHDSGPRSRTQYSSRDIHALKILAGKAIIWTVDWGSMIADEIVVHRSLRSAV